METLKNLQKTILVNVFYRNTDLKKTVKPFPTPVVGLEDDDGWEDDDDGGFPSSAFFFFFFSDADRGDPHRTQHLPPPLRSLPASVVRLRPGSVPSPSCRRAWNPTEQ